MQPLIGIKRQRPLLSLTFFFLGFLLLEGCGYSVRMVNMEEERREVQNKKNLEGEVSRLQSQMAAAQTALKELQADLKQAREESRKGIDSLQKRRADVDVRLDETQLQLRMVQGNIEKEGHRFRELSHQIENVAFRVNDLAEMKARLNEQEKKLQGQIDSIKLISSGLQKSSDEQTKKLAIISEQLSELTEKIPPALNAQAVQLNDLGSQFERMSKGADIDQMSQSLADLSGALEVLGQKITSKVDEQEQRLKKAMARLQALEAKLGSKGKKSSYQAESEGPLLSEIYYELGGNHDEFNEVGWAREAFDEARSVSGPPAEAGVSAIGPARSVRIDAPY